MLLFLDDDVVSAEVSISDCVVTGAGRLSNVFSLQVAISDCEACAARVQYRCFWMMTCSVPEVVLSDREVEDGRLCSDTRVLL